MDDMAREVPDKFGDVDRETKVAAAGRLDALVPSWNFCLRPKLSVCSVFFIWLFKLSGFSPSASLDIPSHCYQPYLLNTAF